MQNWPDDTKRWFTDHLEEAEVKALRAIQLYNWSEAVMWIDRWKTLHQLSGFKLPTPFAPFAALAHEKLQQKGRG